MGADNETVRRLVVAGHGPAAHRLVEALRERDTAGAWNVTVIGEEPRTAYDRVALTAYLEGADLAYPPHGDEVAVRTGERVTAIDRAARTVATDTGRRVPYDALVLATGSAPFVPPVPGAGLPGVFVYRTIDDLDAVRAYAAGRSAGVVGGGGLLGLEAARGLAGRGLDVTVLHLAGHLMERQLDPAAGRVLDRTLEGLGIGARTADGVARETRAGTGCGGCREAVEGILAWLADQDSADQGSTS